MSKFIFLKRRFERIFPVILIAGLFSFVACKKPMDNSKRIQASELYQKSVRLIRLYTDSFENAQDSATLLNLNERFTSSLTALNFKYPSETCLEISEGENDTLTNLTEKIISVRDSLLYLYAHPVISDSLSSDSIPEENSLAD